MKKYYFPRITLICTFLFAISLISYGQRKLIQLVGANPYETIEIADQTLMDTISQWVDVKYASQDEFNGGSTDTLYSKINGVIFFESCASYALGNFGSVDDFPVPSITMEAGVFQNDDLNPAKYWNMLADNGGIWGYGGENCETVDLQWKIIGADHTILSNLGYKNNDVVTWSGYDTPSDYGIPYLHNLDLQVKILAVAARQNPGTVEGFVQNQAMAMFEVPSKNLLFMNTAKKFLEPGFGTKQYYNILHQAVIYMFFPSSSSVFGTQKDAGSITIYPNPFSDAMNVNFSATPGQNASIVLFNATGQKVLIRQHITTAGINRVYLDVNDIPRGMYVLKVELGDMSSYKKVISE